MKIAYVIDALHTDEAGTESQLRLLIEAMQTRGHSVRLYVLRHTEHSQYCDYPCEIEEVGFRSFFALESWRNAWRLRQALKRSSTEIVHGFFNDAALLLPPLLSFTNIKRFTSRRDMGIWYTMPKLWLLRLNAMSRCRIICNSLAVLRYTKEAEWLTADRMFCAYNALRAESAASAAASALAEQVAAANTVNVCLVANIKPVKQIDTLLRAAAKVAGLTSERVDYHIIGAIADAAYHRELLQLIDQLDLNERVHFHQAIPGIRAVLGHFDIGVLSSKSEGLSNTVLEYLNAGLATIASDTGGNPEVITHEQNGLLFAPGDSQQLAAQLTRLITDPELRSRLGHVATESAADFSMAAMSDAHEGIYRGTTAHWHVEPAQ